MAVSPRRYVNYSCKPHIYLCNGMWRYTLASRNWVNFEGQARLHRLADHFCWRKNMDRKYLQENL